MIKLLDNNDVLEASNLMSSTIEHDKDIVGFDPDYLEVGTRNEAVWILNLITHITNQTNNPNYLAIKSVDKNNKMLGFMIASVYDDAYIDKPVMDVKDMIVDYSLGKKQNVKTVCECFDYMIEHTKKYGGSDWRADTIHREELALPYVSFLSKRYNAKIKYGVRGTI